MTDHTQHWRPEETAIIRDMRQMARELGIVDLLEKHQRIINGPQPVHVFDLYDVISEALARLGEGIGSGPRVPTLRDVAELMDGTEWDAGTLDAIANILRQAGFTLDHVWSERMRARDRSQRRRRAYFVIACLFLAIPLAFIAWSLLTAF